MQLTTEALRQNSDKMSRVSKLQILLSSSLVQLFWLWQLTQNKKQQSAKMRKVENSSPFGSCHMTSNISAVLKRDVVHHFANALNCETQVWNLADPSLFQPVGKEPEQSASEPVGRI